MKRVAILDDDKNILEIIEQHIYDIDSSIFVEVYDNTEALFYSIEHEESYDTYIIDIFLGNDNGIDFVKKLYEKHPGAFVILISGQPRSTFDVYDVDHVYFLEKPIDPNLLKKALLKIESIEKGASLKVEFSSTSRFIPYKDITYIESKARKVIVHTSYDSYQFYSKLNSVFELLPPFFRRIHKSVIVNNNFLLEEKKKEVTLLSGETFSISRSYIQKG